MGGQWFEMLLALVVLLFPMLLAWAYLAFGSWRKRGSTAFRRFMHFCRSDHN